MTTKFPPSDVELIAFYQARVGELRTEGERLRAALEEIADASWPYDPDAADAAHAMQRVAARALERPVDECCPACGEVSAKTLMCRSCTLEQNDRDSAR